MAGKGKKSVARMVLIGAFYRRLSNGFTSRHNSNSNSISSPFSSRRHVNPSCLCANYPFNVYAIKFINYNENLIIISVNSSFIFFNYRCAFIICLNKCSFSAEKSTFVCKMYAK